MLYRGHVKNGVVVLDDPRELPDGTEVSVRSLRAVRRSPRKGKQPPTLYERLKPVIGKAKGLPPDAARNHDHYLYGAPKK
jgi:hypothetical protein